MNNLVSLTELIVKGLVTDSDSVSVKEFESDEDNTTLIEVMVSSDDIAKVIGHGGKTINAIRTIVQAASFSQDNKLIKIFNSYSFNSEDKTVYEDTLNTYISRSKDINNMGGNSKVINDDENNTFVFENIIDKEIDLSSIDVNYFVLSSNYNDVLNQLSGKGFDCK